MEERTKTAPRPSPKRTISKRASPRPMAAEPQPSSETGKRVAAATSKTSPFRLAVPCAAKERPYGGSHQRTLQALRWEAPKGQPVIRRENLEVVRVEAPQGQPRNRRRHSQKPHATIPTDEKRGREVRGR